tara:strand:- start:372 stop:626 length:255 start_codon:yes stop_codon:yes gene_type:complete
MKSTEHDALHYEAIETAIGALEMRLENNQETLGSMSFMGIEYLKEVVRTNSYEDNFELDMILDTTLTLKALEHFKQMKEKENEK